MTFPRRLMGSMLDRELADRRRWCTENCGHFVVEPRRTHAEGHPYHVVLVRELDLDAVLFQAALVTSDNASIRARGEAEDCVILRNRGGLTQVVGIIPDW